jgi:hypothetical protein
MRNYTNVYQVKQNRPPNTPMNAACSKPVGRYHKNMRQLFVLGYLLWRLPPLAAADHWTRFNSGPFEVFSSAGQKDGRETLVRFEEFAGR